MLAVVLAVGVLYNFAPSHAAIQTVNVSMPDGSGLPAGAPGFAPATIKVVIGVNNTILFTNMDTGAFHTVTCTVAASCPEQFDSGQITKVGSPTNTFTHTFNTAGTYAITCSYHNWMKMTVNVLAATPASSTTSTSTSTTPEFPAGAIAVVLLVAIAGMVVALRAFPRLRGPTSV